MQLDRHAVGDVVRHQGRDADAQVDVEPVPQFLRGSGGHLIAGPGHAASPQYRLRTVRCSIRLSTVCNSTIRCTKIPGVMMWSGSIWPAATMCSTSATVTSAAV